MTTPTNNHPRGGPPWDPDDNPPVRIPSARRPDTSPDALAEAWADVAAVTSPDTEPDALADTEPDTRPDITSDTEPDSDPDIQPDAGTDMDPDTSPDAGPPRVDGPELAGPSLLERTRASRRRPVVPPWASSREELHDAARWVVGHYTHAAGYHAARSPLYAAKLTARAPLGAARVTGRTLRWLSDAEGAPVRWAAVRHENAEIYLKLSRQRDARVRMRVILATAALMLGGSAAMVLAVAAPAWALYAAGGAVVAALGAAGRPGDRPLIDRAVVAPKVSRLTSDIVVRALSALGIAEINKAMGRGGGGITFPAPITRDGPGWRADVDLPYGVTVTDIIERRDRLASGLRRPMGCVWPEPAHDEHAGRLVLWVGDQDMNQAKPPAWPLARHGQGDVFKPVPFGTDQRGRGVGMGLMFANVLIGAMPRFGKTFAMRVLLLAAALDPRCELRVFELKGTGDLSALEKVAYHYGSGPDDATIEACVVSLREVYAELERRAKTISGLPKDLCPENKVTPQLAGRRSLGLHPLLVGVDECQELFSHPVFGKEAGELCTAIIKRGPAMGVILVLATQRPDKDSLPTGVSANVGIRFCLRVMGQVENDMVLGTSAYRNGVRATTFTQRDKGIGYLVGAADDPQIARSYYIDAPAAERITTRARALRVTAGTLAGHAIGETTHTEGTTTSVLDDVLAVVPAGEAKVWNEHIVTRLAQLRPDTYTGWGPEQLTAALKPHGVPTGQVWGATEHGRGANRRGITRDHLTTAVTERHQKRGGH
ncbi:MAG: cell division protein FtsK [Streptomycetales bacterium]